ncbi:PREDICTED: patatin-like phospholipase domain-containing protein 1 [Charadrius vociferus]|uniref:patatin-like phospholipase domain-containing protein 1 n=1 Tax=Charadrius vociferus TaxID=50402 RepID=UPI00052173BF|nr:PREDICTED: patatin-like phospholipase domain-containing protein 1 [Charadrius vociferus]
MMKINGNEGRPFSILFRGCSFLILYEAGVLAALRELSPDILKSASRIYGASSGSVVATLALCECDIGKAIKLLKEVLNKYLPTNAHQLVSGKLHVILTRLRDWKCVLVSEFASREDLIQAITCSCFIPVYFGLLPPTYHGVRYVDGELCMWRANFVSRTTITVSAFAGEYDICPKDCPAAFFTFQLSDCTESHEAPIAGPSALTATSPLQVLNQFFIHGYQDTVSYFKRLSK